MEFDRRPRRGIIFILSAPSGAGKTTISRAALKAIEGLEASVSLTTRAPRENEVDGLDYHFVSDEEFKRRVGEGQLAEWARVFDASYGTPRPPLERAIASGSDILLDIDIQGARQIRSIYPRDAVTIFVFRQASVNSRNACAAAVLKMNLRSRSGSNEPAKRRSATPNTTT
jgi:guanylate kinase